MSLYWLVLFLACGTEIAWAIGLKLIQTHFSVWVVALAGVLTVVSMIMVSFAMRGIPVGTAYAIWTGLGGAEACHGRRHLLRRCRHRHATRIPKFAYHRRGRLEADQLSDEA